MPGICNFNKNGCCLLKTLSSIVFLFIITVSCNVNDVDDSGSNSSQSLAFGSDFSIMKLMEDFGGVYKINGIEKEGLLIFKENGFTWARLRLFHSPDIKGQVCNNLPYTIELANRAKKLGFKIHLDIVYSDQWADPGHQIVPDAWKNLRIDLLKDSVYFYTRNVLNAMTRAGVQPNMVQIGNEVGNGIMWPQGNLWVEGGNANWDNVCDLLKAGIKGVRDANNSDKIKIMIHAATGGDITASNRFYNNIIDRGVEFDVIGLSYYPWWHGDFQQLENSIYSLSKHFDQDISIVETAYYSYGWYPEATDWVLMEKPFPPTEQGQYDFMVQLAKIVKLHPQVKSVFYWKPDELDIPESKVPFQGRSLFDQTGNAFKGISAWKYMK